MPVKEWFRQHQPIQLHFILILTIIYFIVELIYSHITHALTLLIDSYHTLCNIFALTGCIIAIKYGEKDSNSVELKESASTKSTVEKDAEIETLNSPQKRERTLKNTFGWARIDVISMLICSIFLASLSFSVLVEALQTLVHIDHLDEMHHPISVLLIGVVGLILDVVCYILIGGYTFHQGSFMYLTEKGEAVLNRVVVPDMVRQGGRRLSRTRPAAAPPDRHRQGCIEMFRDIMGSLFIIVCAIIVYTTKQDIAKYVDPIISLISAALLIVLSYPYMKESCLILLQTIPGSIDIESFKTDLLKHFPEIVNVHDFHIWQLTANKVISTVHIIFKNKNAYKEQMKDIVDFFTENFITQVTIQPEFLDNSDLKRKLENCLMPCQKDCELSLCCPNYEMQTEHL